MSNIIKQAGHDAVIAYEKRNGRNAKCHEKDGYDIISTGQNEVRHIEVKATAKKKFQWRWLTQNEFNAVVKDPHFYLYLVTEAISNPQIKKMRRDELMKRYKGTTILHVFTFPKSLEAKDNEIEEC